MLFRSIPDPYFYLLATSDAQENAKLYALAREKEAERAPTPLLSAVRELAGTSVEGLGKSNVTPLARAT